MKDNLAPRVSDALHRRWEPVYRSRLHYFVTWSTRGHKPALKERHALRLGETIPRLCEERGVESLEVAVGQDHVHVLFGLRPVQSVASVVREIKSRAGLELLSDFPELRIRLGGNLMWDDRYSVETVSSNRLERVRERLKNLHDRPERLARAS